MRQTLIGTVAAIMAAGLLGTVGCEAVKEETGLNEEGQAGATAGATLGGFTGVAAGGSAAWGAGGMILGALLGGYLGQQMGSEPESPSGDGQLSGPLKLGPVEICFQNACIDREDRREHGASTYDAFLNEPVGSETSWENPATGSHGTTRITAEYLRADGSPCKRFTQRIVLKGEDGTQRVDGAACKDGDGTWRVVDVSPQPGGATAG